ncbi:uncharacterized protein A4U43_C05F18790 [Asparagus officinalis]|uniref:Protein ABIL5 n=1 Tax=Asparagus officinalis TaxID=4686 RepID=A0A5P1ESR9_ASPOF|nr:probable protein ABIL5 [Asparagus officinalis]ONK69052.1 uncharacterized protein A4U43_C05F18790 [Asparagus officinalis]
MLRTMPLPFKSPSLQNPEPEPDVDRFNRSLRELKDLRSQLYNAADYCEKAFLKTDKRKILLENTKSYVCEVVVTVVDHLGTVSSNLEQRVYGNNRISQAEQRIDCLKQRLFTCQQYAFRLELSSLLLSAKHTRHHRHYITTPSAKNLEEGRDASRVDAIGSNMPETSLCKKDQSIEAASIKPVLNDNIIFKPPVTYSISGTELTTVPPVFESPLRLLKPSNPSFGSPAKDTFKLGGSELKKKSPQGSNFLTFLKKSRRRT